MTISRRNFLAASGATLAATTLAAPAVHGADSEKKFRVALIGTGWWGMNILNAAIESGTVTPVAMCDVDTNQLDPAVKKVEDKSGITPNKYSDYRELLEKEKPEIVIVGTPDHWHPLITIAACNAGAHVYVEKPICHTIHEGVAMIQAARDNNRVVQVGTHRRASPHNQSAIEFLKSGKLGKIGMVRCFVHYPGGPGYKTPDSTPPEGLDWDMWCGPAPLVPFNKTIHPKGFRKHMTFANGQIGDWGIHWLDQMLWWSEEQHPKRVGAIGARHIKQDSTDAPDTHVVHYEFDDFTATWENRFYAGNGAEKHNVGCYFYGTEGTLHLGWLDGWTLYPRSSANAEPREHVEPQLDLPDNQNIAALWTDFIESIKAGRRPMCDIEIGHRATTLSLLGVLSMQLGRSVEWDPKTQSIPNDPEANAMLCREYREPWKYPEFRDPTTFMDV